MGRRIKRFARSAARKISKGGLLTAPIDMVSGGRFSRRRRIRRRNREVVEPTNVENSVVSKAIEPKAIVKEPIKSESDDTPKVDYQKEIDTLKAQFNDVNDKYQSLKNRFGESQGVVADVNARLDLLKKDNQNTNAFENTNTFANKYGRINASIDEDEIRKRFRF